MISIINRPKILLLLLLFICISLQVESRSNPFERESKQHQVLDCQDSNSDCSNPANYSYIKRLSTDDVSTRDTNYEDSNFENCQTASVICEPKEEQNITSNSNNNTTINLYIRTVAKNETHLEKGANLTLECRINLQQEHKNAEFQFKWLRNVALNPGFNQSIQESETQTPISISPATSRIRMMPKLNGIDLELEDFQYTDSGSYFCQAIPLGDAKEISEAKIDLYLNSTNTDFGIRTNSFDNQTEENNVINSTELQQYSQENLAKLLPALEVRPESMITKLGQAARFICITIDIEQPDPDPDEISWSFESSDRLKLNSVAPAPLDQLPHNVTQMGNVLVIWSVSEDNVGLYRCSHKSREVNMTSESIGELILAPNSHSAPFVSVSPELVRLSPNGSSTIQCEATGYPAPTLSWHRVEDLILQTANPINTSSDKDNSKREEFLPSFVDANIVIENIPYQDSSIYCEINKCSINKTKYVNREQVTAISLMHVELAQTHHQGQYLCRAKNDHGSNQATTLIDIELRDPPIVEITSAKDQTIILSEQINDGSQVVTFECTVISGNPQPSLRWLRISPTAKSHLLSNSNNFENLETYDLTKISTAGSNITTKIHNNGNSLTLFLNKISTEDEGEYACLGENQWGRNSASAHLTVRKPAHIQIPHLSPHIVKINDSFHLDCIVSGHPIPIDIEWSRSDRGAFFSLISRNSNSQIGSQEKATLKFDRVTFDDSGEYTCNARDSTNSSLVLRDTIMVIVEEPSSQNETTTHQRIFDTLLPKLIVRPTKINALVGSNVTLDCLAVSGLQPTIVEWIGPPLLIDKINDNNVSVGIIPNVKPYYRQSSYREFVPGVNLLQFGSKLKIMNITRAHEGVYQCKGRNKVGVENAPALLKVYKQNYSETNNQDDPESLTKARVASVGSNIELKCQVEGVDQPITSWSRDGLELPKKSVQIKHNLWIQNVTVNDSGLYICSVKTMQPNKVIQAKIKLMVKGELSNAAPHLLQNLTAKIVASKNVVNAGDSITLECIISRNNHSLPKTEDEIRHGQFNTDQESIEELLSNTVWTNLHSGQSLFQDNVYTMGNILIIYEVKPENTATYRCNYNELTQYTDYNLQIQDVPVNPIMNNQSIITGNESNGIITGANGKKAEVRKFSSGLKVILDCPLDEYDWYRGDLPRTKQTKKLSQQNKPLVLESITTEEADTYHCYSNVLAKEYSFILQVTVAIPRFTQKPFSFITLPTISGANHQLDLEIKFLPERDNGLILFNGQQLGKPSTAMNGDYISLGLSNGYLEFRFELGDGTTQLRSLQTLALNQWHKVIIERNLKGAVMYIDRQLPVSNSSAGKFLNLNLDSVLYIGGHQYFMINNNKTRVKPFYGYSRGFQGCISSLKIFRNEINLMAKNRGVSENIFECDKSECLSKSIHCNMSNSICQVDRISKYGHKLDSVKRASGSDEFRCLCLPGYSGYRCDKEASNATLVEKFANSSTSITLSLSKTEKPKISNQSSASIACDPDASCAPNGTSKCQSLTSTSFRCHCLLGYMGSSCSEQATFLDETSLGFNGQAFLQLRFNEADFVRSYQEESKHFIRNDSASYLASNLTTQPDFDWVQFAKLTNVADNLNLSFKIQTKSSYGIIFYIGGHQQHQANLTVQIDGAKASLLSHSNSIQTSKSMVANLLSKLPSYSGQFYVDYLSIALVDGHVELSFELGSGVAIIRSSQRINDGNIHTIEITRSGKFGRLIIDEQHKQEGSSPGKLSVLNSEPDIYLGGLPHIMLDMVDLPSSGILASTSNHLSSFVGCISNLKINSLGPFNLIRSSLISQLKAARNLVPCGSLPTLEHNFGIPSSTTMSTAEMQSLSDNAEDTVNTKLIKTKPYHPTSSVGSDDPDEM